MLYVFLFYFCLISVVFASEKLNNIKRQAVKVSEGDNSTVSYIEKSANEDKKKSNISIGVEATTEFHSIKIKSKK